jgi:nucleoside phosphorylase
VVLCALRVEYVAVRAYVADLQPRDHPAGTRFEVGKLARSGWEVALAMIGSGNVGAGVLAERAVRMFDPDVLLCVGVAGALKDDLELGDVVVDTRIDAYHGGTAAEDFLARPRTWDADHRLSAYPEVLRVTRCEAGG